jgi:hypothetical protein
VQVGDEVLPRLACLQENQDFEDFLIPNCQYTAMPEKITVSDKQGTNIQTQELSNIINGTLHGSSTVTRDSPYSEELQGPIDSQHPTIEDGLEYFSVIFGEVHMMNLTSML